MQGGAVVRVIDSTIAGSGRDGVFVSEGDDVVLRRVQLDGNGRYGLQAVDTHKLRLVDSSVLESAAAGVQLVGSQGSSLYVLKGSLVGGSGGDGVAVTGSELKLRVRESSSTNNAGYGLWRDSEGCTLAPRQIKLIDSSFLNNAGEPSDVSSADLGEHCSILDDKDDTVISTSGDEGPGTRPPFDQPDFVADPELMGDFGACSFVVAGSGARGHRLGGDDEAPCTLAAVSDALVEGHYRLRLWSRSEAGATLSLRVDAAGVEPQRCPTVVDLYGGGNPTSGCDAGSCSEPLPAGAWVRTDLCFTAEEPGALKVEATTSDPTAEAVVEQWSLHRAETHLDQLLGGPRPGTFTADGIWGDVPLYWTGDNLPVEDPCAVHDPERNEHYLRLGDWPDGAGGVQSCEGGAFLVTQPGAPEEGFTSLSFSAAALGAATAEVPYAVGLSASSDTVLAPVPAELCPGATHALECGADGCLGFAPVRAGRTWQSFFACFEIVSGGLDGFELLSVGAGPGGRAQPVVVDDFALWPGLPLHRGPGGPSNSSGSAELLALAQAWQQVGAEDAVALKALLPEVSFGSRAGFETPSLLLLAPGEHGVDELGAGLEAAGLDVVPLGLYDEDGAGHPRRGDGLRVHLPRGADTELLMKLLRALQLWSVSVPEADGEPWVLMEPRWAAGEHSALAAAREALLDCDAGLPCAAPVQPWVDAEQGLLGLSLVLSEAEAGVTLQELWTAVDGVPWESVELLALDEGGDRWLWARGWMHAAAWDATLALTPYAFASRPASLEELGLSRATLGSMLAAMDVELCGGRKECVGKLSRVQPGAGAEEASLRVSVVSEGFDEFEYPDTSPLIDPGQSGWSPDRGYYPGWGQIGYDGSFDPGSLLDMLRELRLRNGFFKVLVSKGVVHRVGLDDDKLAGWLLTQQVEELGPQDDFPFDLEFDFYGDEPPPVPGGWPPGDDDDDSGDDDDSSAGDDGDFVVVPLRPSTSVHQSATWLLPYALDPTSCPAQAQGAFLGERQGWPGTYPDPPESLPLASYRPDFPTYAFFPDYLQCRLRQEYLPRELTEPSVGFAWCGELVAHVDDELSASGTGQLDDLFALVVGVPLDSPLGVRNGRNPGGGEYYKRFEWGEDVTAAFAWIGAEVAGPLPIVQFQALDSWRIWLDTPEPLEQEATISLRGLVHVPSFDLALEYGIQRAAGLGDLHLDVTEQVTVPEWSWRWTAEYSVRDWSLQRIRVDAVDFAHGAQQWDLSAVVPGTVEGWVPEAEFRGQVADLVSDLVRETLQSRFEASQGALQTFLRSYYFMANPLMAASASDVSDYVLLPGTSSAVLELTSGTREVLAVDVVDPHELWFDDTDCHTLDQEAFPALGVAAVVEAEVPTLLTQTTDVPLLGGADSFASIPLDDQAAWRVWTALGMDGVAKSEIQLEPVDYSGSLTRARSRTPPLNNVDTSEFLYDFFEGYAAWAFNPSQLSFDCGGPASDYRSLCMLTTPPTPMDSPHDPCLVHWPYPDVAPSAEQYCDCREQRFVESCVQGMDPEWIGPSVSTILPSPLTTLSTCSSIQGISVESLELVSASQHRAGLEPDEVPVCPQQVPRVEVDEGSGEVTLVLPHCVVAEIGLVGNINAGGFLAAPPPIGPDPTSCPGTPADVPAASTFPGSRSEMRPGSTEASDSFLWQDYNVVFAADVAADLTVDMGVSMEFHIPLSLDASHSEEFAVGGVGTDWDSAAGWAKSLLWYVDLLDAQALESAFTGDAPAGLPRTGVVFSLSVDNVGIGTVGATLYRGPASYDLGCPDSSCDADAPPDWCDQVDPHTHLVKGQTQTLHECMADTYRSQLDTALSLIRSATGQLALDLDIPSFFPGVMRSAGLQPATYFIHGVDDPDLDHVHGLNHGLARILFAQSDLPVLVAMSLGGLGGVDDGAYLAGSLDDDTGHPPVNNSIAAYQQLFAGLRLDQIASPSREAAWLALVDPLCGTLGNPSANAGDCAYDPLGLGAVHEGLGTGLDGPAVWRLRPDYSRLEVNDSPAVSWEPWRPGRL